MLHHHLHPQHLRGFAKLFNSGKFSYENILKSWHCTFLSNDITLNTLKLFILPELGLQPFRECKSQKIPQSFRRAWICKIVRQKCCICNLFKFLRQNIVYRWKRKSTGSPAQKGWSLSLKSLRKHEAFCWNLSEIIKPFETFRGTQFLRSPNFW